MVTLVLPRGITLSFRQRSRATLAHCKGVISHPTPARHPTRREILTHLSLEVARVPAYRAGVRYFFHIVDQYGLFPDGAGSEHADQDSAELHARNIAAELAKAGELFRSSVVFVSRDGDAKPSSSRDQDTAAHTAEN
jgi:hypothetical protein